MTAGRGVERCSDAELVAATRGGDKHAFAVLVGRHRPLALALVRRMLGQGELASDAVQEATVTALTGIDRLRSPERFGAWYAGVALNIARRWARDLARLGPIEGLDRPDGARGPEEATEAALLAKQVRTAVAELAPGQRAAILAFHWQGLTQTEAALELGTTAGAIKARLHQARVALVPKLLSLRTPEVTVMATEPEPGWVEMTVAEVRRSGGDDPRRYRHAVILSERAGDRRLAIWVGAPEATHLAHNLQSVEMPRPMTYQLAANLAQAGGSRVAEVRITQLAETTYYAQVVLEGPTGRKEVDARPSDALNLALVCDAPITMATSILEDPDCMRRTEWQEYPTGASELVAEAHKHQEEAMKEFLATETAREQQGPAPP